MRLTLTATAVAIGLAFQPAPAAAGRDDVARVLAGLLTLGVVAAALNNANRSTATAAPVARRSAPDPTVGLRPLGNQHSYGGAKTARVLPQRCLRTYQSQGRFYDAFGQRCLQRNFAAATSLPKQCQRSAWSDRGKRVVYAPRCLRRAGYRVEARRDD